MLSFLVNVPDTCTEVNQIMLQVSQSQRRILNNSNLSVGVLTYYCITAWKWKKLDKEVGGGGAVLSSLRTPLDLPLKVKNKH